MRVKDLDTLPPETVNRLDPVRVQEYARATGWRLESRLGRGRVAVYERLESRLEQVSIPLNRELTDFALVMATAVAGMAQYENRVALDLLVELLFPPADLLRFAESSPVARAGDVPFDRGLALMSGMRKTLLAAACGVARPGQTFYPRMSLTEAEQFLQECRLGQTERGSFVLSVACPLGAVPEPANGIPLFDNTPFTRRVTVLLMRSLHQLVYHLDRGDVDSLSPVTANAPILSANLCEGLLDLKPEGDDAFVRISATWSSELPTREDDLPASVQLRREVFPLIETVARRLRPEARLTRQRLVGFVETLNGRPSKDNRPEGQVVLRVIPPEGEVVRARAELNAEDYAVADRAHMRNLPFSLEGVLRPVGRTFRIDEVAGFEIIHETEVAVEETR